LHCITLPELRTGGVEYSYKIQIRLLQKQLRPFKLHYNEIHNTQTSINKIKLFTTIFHKHYVKLPQVKAINSPVFYVFKKGSKPVTFPV
jgi:hypothetical protein